MHFTLSPNRKIVLLHWMSRSDSSSMISDGEQQSVKQIGPTLARWEVALLYCSCWLWMGKACANVLSCLGVRNIHVSRLLSKTGCRPLYVSRSVMAILNKLLSDKSTTIWSKINLNLSLIIANVHLTCLSGWSVDSLELLVTVSEEVQTTFKH